MTVDIWKIKPGDELTLKRAKVGQVSRNTAHSNPIEVLLRDAENHVRPIWVSGWAVAEHHPRPPEFATGDVVGMEQYGRGKGGVVIYAARGLAWVQWADGSENLNRFQDLTFMGAAR